jgi:NADH-quinone oxidoreductase subunit N
MPATLDNFASLRYFAPELVITAAALAVILWDLGARSHRAKVLGSALLAVTGLATAAALSASYLAADVAPRNLFATASIAAGTPRSAVVAGGLLAFDDFAHTFRILFAAVGALIVVFIAPPALGADGPRADRRNIPEMITLLLVITLGLNLMASSRHLLMIYLSLEMVSVISFVMAGFKLGDRKSAEGALKYVIFGGVASGVMLYGMSWIYGLTRSLHLAEIYAAIDALVRTEGKVPEAVFVGVVCMLAGFGYKISAAPFHMWTPDVYEGAPTPVTAFFSVGPKAAGLAVLVRFFHDALGAREGLGAVAEAAGSAAAEVPWTVVGGCLAIATMTVGNLTALNQDNVKRMLAYSSIAHAGYMLLGFSVFNAAGVTAIVFYIVAYCFMNLGAFLVVLAVAEATGGDETLAAFRGLGRRAPVTAVVMTVFLVSLAGIPPMAGFIGKFYLFAALIDKGGGWNWVLAVVGVVNSVVSLFYYARVIRAMYLDGGEVRGPLDVRRAFGAVSVALAVPTLVLGIYWAPVYDFVAGSLGMTPR